MAKTYEHKIAYSTFTPPANIPAYKWTQRNRALAFLHGTGDARGYQQWTEAGRHIKKGSKSVYILGPILKKSNQVVDIFDEKTGETQHEEIMECVGYHAIPVFRVEDTEGQPLEYLPLDALAQVFDKMLATMKECEGIDFVKFETSYNFCFSLAVFWISTFMHNCYQNKTNRKSVIEVLYKLEKEILSDCP